MKFLDTSKSRGWVVAICLIVVIGITTWNKWENLTISDTLNMHTSEIDSMKKFWKVSELRQDTFNTRVTDLENRKRNIIYNTQIIERDHEAKINAYNKLDSTGQIGFITDWLIEQERLSGTD